MVQLDGPPPSCPPLLTNGTATIASLLADMRIELNGGLVVNLGAALRPAGARTVRSNVDDAWTFFFAHGAKSNLSMLAFEGSPQSFAINNAILTSSQPGLLQRITSVNAYVSSHTIVAEFTRRGVSRVPLLLKCDIDSIDLPVVGALLDGGVRPHLILAEHNKRIPLPIKWAALDSRPPTPAASPQLTPRPTYGMGQHWTAFHCNGASLAMWHALGRRHGYTLLQSNEQNVLLVPTAFARARNTPIGLQCHTGSGRNKGALGSETTRSLLANFSIGHEGSQPAGTPLAAAASRRALVHAAMLNEIGIHCTRQHTPYTVEELGRSACACPDARSARAPEMCACEYAGSHGHGHVDWPPPTGST